MARPAGVVTRGSAEKIFPTSSAARACATARFLPQPPARFAVHRCGEETMNKLAEYMLVAGAAACALAFVGCAFVTLVLIPVAFGGGVRTFSETKDLRDILTVREESPWVMQVYRILRKVQYVAALGAVGLGGCAAVWQIAAMTTT
jgi:hypothetical protein